MPSYSSDSSGSDEGVHVEDILRRIGLKKKYGKIFAKHKIEGLDEALELSDRRLKKLGVLSASHRKKIIEAISEEVDSDSGSSFFSSSDDEELTPVEKLLQQNGLLKIKPLVRYLNKKNIEDIRDLKQLSLSDTKLKSLSISSSKQRTKILDTLGAKSSRKKRNSGSGSGSGSSRSRGSNRSRSSSPVNEKKVIREILQGEGFEDAAQTLFRNKIKTIKAARDLTPEKLKQFGVDSLGARSAILSAFSNSPNAQEILKKHNLLETQSGTSVTDSEADDENALYKALNRVHLGRLFDYFKKRGIAGDSIRTLQKLGHEELKDLGLDNRGQRDLILDAIAEADWKCVYCETWNEHRKACMVCRKAFRRQEGEEEKPKFEVDQKVKYVGKFRPTTRLKYGEKGKVNRVIGNQFYMVVFENRKDKKTVTIRLAQKELCAC